MENRPIESHWMDEKIFEEAVMRIFNEKLIVKPASAEDKKLAADFLESIPKEKSKIKDIFTPYMAYYITHPTITDELPDNIARIAFLKRLESENALREFYQKNKLKRDNMYSVISALGELSKYKDLNGHEEEKRIELSASIEKYNDLMPLAEKLAYVEELTQFCRDFINRRMK